MSSTGKRRSIHRWAFCAALSLAGVGAAAAAEVCAPRPGQALRHIEVFDGPPEELASLVPDVDTASSAHWTLGHVYDAGRSVTVRCKYLDGQTVDVRLAERIQRCDYRANARRVMSIRCK